MATAGAVAEAVRRGCQLVVAAPAGSLVADHAAGRYTSLLPTQTADQLAVAVTVLDLLGLTDEPGFGVLTRVLGIALAVGVDTVVFLWLLRIVPSVSHPLRLLLPGALFGAAGIEVLKLIGGYYLSLISDSVTASAFGGAVGLLVYLYVFNQLLLFGAAWAATSPHGRVVDLSADDKTAPVGQNTWIRHRRPE